VRQLFTRHNLMQIKQRLPSIYQIRQGLCRALISLSVTTGSFFLSATTAFATTTSNSNTATAAPGQGSDIWVWLDYALGDLYNKFLSVSTIAACVAASICLILMNFSTDDRAVGTSRAWLKRILFSWVILNVLGYIMTYFINLTQGGAYIP